MAISVTCFSCHSVIQAQEADRGKSVRCDICWAEVQIPAAGVASQTLPSELKPVPRNAAKPITSTDERLQRPSSEIIQPLETKPDSDELMIAEVIDDEDTAPGKPQKSTAKASKSNNPSRTKSASGSGVFKWVLMIGGLFLVIFIAGVSVTAYFVYTALNLPKQKIEAQQPELSDSAKNPLVKNPPPTTSSSSDSSMTRSTSQDSRPTFTTPATSNPPPGVSTTNPAWQLPWQTYTDPSSFSILMPPNVQKQPRTINLDGETLRGHSFSSKEAHVTYRVEYFDLPDELPISPHQFTHRLYDPTLGTSPPKGRLTLTRLDGRSAVENRFSTFAPVILTKSTQVGCRIFIALISRNDREDRNYPSFDFDAVSQRFFNSMKITFDPSTPAPLSSKVPFAGPKTLPPGSGLGKQPSPKLVTPKFITRLEPFTGSAYLTQSSRLLTISPTNSQTTLRVISGDSYKTLQSMTLTTVFQHLVVDEKNNRLILGGGSVLGPADSMIGNNLRCDIHVYELEKLLAAAGSGLELPKPVATRTYPRKLHGLALSPDGQELFLGLNEPAKMPSSGRFSVEKLSVKTLASVDEVRTDMPIYGLRLSPDGKTLATWLHPYSSAGLAVFSFRGNAPIEFYDALTLQKQITLTSLGLVSDVQFLTSERAVAITVMDSSTKLYHLTTKGESTELIPPTGPLRAPQGGFVSCDVSPQSSAARIVVTSRLGSSLDIFKLNLDVPKPAIESVGSAAVYPGALITGPSRILPSGKALVIGSGLILDISSQ